MDVVANGENFENIIIYIDTEIFMIEEKTTSMFKNNRSSPTCDPEVESELMTLATVLMTDMKVRE